MNQTYHRKVSKASHRKSKKTLENLSESYRKLAPYLNIGTFWAASVLIFTWLGWYLDRKWNTHPWFTIIGAFIGIGAGFYNFFKVVLKENEKNKVGKSNNME